MGKRSRWSKQPVSHSLRSTIRGAAMLQPPKNQLPPELWLEIWSNFQIGHRVSASHVSHYWRALALSTPRVWNHVALKLACDWKFDWKFLTSEVDCGMKESTRAAARMEGHLTSLRATRSVLSRGGSCTLHVWVSFDGDHDCLEDEREVLLPLLAPHTDRIVQLYVKTDRLIRMPAFLRKLGSNFGRLQRLQVAEYSDDGTAEPSYTDAATPLTAPLLQCLEVDLGTPSYRAFWANAILPNVTQLRLIPYETANLRTALRLCPALREAYVDMYNFDCEDDLDDDYYRLGEREYLLQHLEVFNVASYTLTEDLLDIILQPCRPSTSVNISYMGGFQKQARATDVFASLYPPGYLFGTLLSATIVSLEAGAQCTGKWSLYFDPNRRFVGIRAQSTTKGECYDPLRDRQRALSILDDGNARSTLSAAWSHLDCGRVTRLTISARDWVNLNLPLPKAFPGSDALQEITSLQFPALSLLQVQASLRQGSSYRSVAHDLQCVAWRAFVPPACEVIASHYVSRGEDEWKAVVKAKY